jgi:hypothetical protein
MTYLAPKLIYLGQVDKIIRGGQSCGMDADNETRLCG